MGEKFEGKKEVEMVLEKQPSSLKEKLESILCDSKSSGKRIHLHSKKVQKKSNKDFSPKVFYSNSIHTTEKL